MAKSLLDGGKEQDVILVAVPAKSYNRIRQVADKKGVSVADFITSSVSRCCDEDEEAPQPGSKSGRQLLTEVR